MSATLSVPIPMPTRHEAYLRHARCYVALAEKANTYLASSEQVTWLRELDADYESLLAALRWLKTQNESTLGSRLTLALCQFWEIRGQWAEARHWLETMVEGAAVDEHPDEALLARVLNETGIFCRMQSDLESASGFFQQALAMHRKRKCLKGQGSALNGLGAIALMRGEQAAAREFLEAALAVHRERNDPISIAQGVGNLALVYFNDGDYVTAEKLQAENLAAARKIGEPQVIADALTNLGVTQFHAGNYQEAKQHHQESLDLRIRLNYQFGLGDSYLNLAMLATKMGEYRTSYAHLRDALNIYHRIGEIEGLACVFEAVAELAVCQEHRETAAFWFAAAAVLRRKHHIPLLAADSQKIKSSLAQVRSTLGEPAFQAAWKRGRTTSLNHAITRALEDEY